MHEQRQRDRVGEEHRQVALADRQRAAELLLGQRPQDQADHAGRHRHVEHAHAEAQDADDPQDDQVDHVVVQRVGAHGREHEDAGIEPGPGDVQQLHPDAGHGQVEHQQQHVADVEAGDQAPDQVGVALEQQRAGLQAVLLERGQHDGGRGRGRQAERQERRQRAGHGGIVGGLGPGHGLDRTLAELLGVLGQALLDQVGEEGRDLAAAGRQGTDREAQERAAQPGLPGTRPVLRTHPDRADQAVDLLLLELVPRGGVERLADREQAHRDDDRVDAVQQLQDAHGEARLAGLQVDADQTQRQADEQAGEAAHQAVAEHGRDRGQRQHHQREIFGRAEQQGQLDQLRCHEAQAPGWRSCRRRTSRSPRSPAPGRRGPCAPSCCRRSR